MKIVYKEQVIFFLTQLIDTLLYREYFSYKESAKGYVQDIRDSAEHSIDISQHRKSPKRLIKYGSYFIKVTKNKRTSWYVFFDSKGTICRVNYITNNHTAKAAHLGVK